MANLQPPPDPSSVRFRGWLRDLWARTIALTGGIPNFLLKIGPSGDVLTSSLREDKVLEDDDVVGTSNEIVVTISPTGTVTISLADLITLKGSTASRLLSTNGSKLTASVTNLSDWIKGSDHNIVVTDNGDGGVILSLPGTIRLSDVTAFSLVKTDSAGILESIPDGVANEFLSTDGAGFYSFKAVATSVVVSYKIEDGETVQVNNYEYLSIDFTGEYIIEGSGSLELNGNSFLSVSGGGI